MVALSDADRARFQAVGIRVRPALPAEREVYFIRAKTLGRIKIGVAVCARQRIAQIAKISPDELELIGVVNCKQSGALERRLHSRFASLRVHGEWFNPGPELMDYIAANAVEPRPVPPPQIDPDEEAEKALKRVEAKIAADLAKRGARKRLAAYKAARGLS